MFSPSLYPLILLKFKCFKSEEREKPFMQRGPILIPPVHVNSGTLQKKLLSIHHFFLASNFNNTAVEVVFLLSYFF